MLDHLLSVHKNVMICGAYFIGKLLVRRTESNELVVREKNEIKAARLVSNHNLHRYDCILIPCFTYRNEISLVIASNTPEMGH